MDAARNQPFFVADTFKGIPLSPVAASVVRDIEREGAQRGAGLQQDDVWQATARAFEPAICTVKGAPGRVSAEAEARLAAVANAASLAEAVSLAAAMPEVATMAKAGPFPLFQRVKKFSGWQVAGAMAPAGSVRPYANHVRLMAYDQGSGPELRLQVVRHFAGNSDYGSRWIHSTETAYDRTYSSKWYALLSAGPTKLGEFFPNLTPTTLADGLRATFDSGQAPVAK